MFLMTWTSPSISSFSLSTPFFSFFSSPLSYPLSLTQLSSAAPGRAELESRLHELTESLIQKQTTLEALSSEKSSLNVQLQRMKVGYTTCWMLKSCPMSCPQFCKHTIKQKRNLNFLVTTGFYHNVCWCCSLVQCLVLSFRVSIRKVRSMSIDLNFLVVTGFHCNVWLTPVCYAIDAIHLKS